MEPRIYKNVTVGKNVKIEEYTLIGVPPKGKEDGELKTAIGDNSIIRSHTIIYAGNIIGQNFQTGHHTLVREENHIGNDVSIGSFANVEHHVTIRDDVRIHSGAFIPEHTTLDKGVWIGPRVVITNAKFPLGKHVKERLQGAHVLEGAKIGAGSVLLPGIIIGKNALVGAGSVVTKEVIEGTVVVGNPARPIKNVQDLSYTDNEKPYEK